MTLEASSALSLIPVMLLLARRGASVFHDVGAATLFAFHEMPPACATAFAVPAVRLPRPILSEIHGLQIQKVSGCTSTDFIAEMNERGYNCHTLEAGKAGQMITSVDEQEVSSVVFIPQSRTDITRDIRQRMVIEQLQKTIVQQKTYIHELERRANWLNEQAQAAQQNLHAVEQGRILRLLRWLRTLLTAFTAKRKQ
jgi:hypothetical protein